MIKGEAQVLSSKEHGGKTYHSVKVNDVWYGLGLEAPSFAKGALIQFEEKQNDKGFWNANGKTLKVLGEVKQKSVQAASSESNWDDKRNLSIEYQTAIKAASEIVSSSIHAGLIDIDSAGTEAITLAQQLFKSMQDRKVVKPTTAPKLVLAAKAPVRSKPAPIQITEEFVEDEEQSDEEQDDMDPYS